MRSAPIGLVMLTDERENVRRETEEVDRRVFDAWADLLRDGLVNRDGTTPEVVVGEPLELDPQTRSDLNTQTDPTWPHVHARLRCPFEEFVALFPSSHVLDVPDGRLRALLCLCEMAGVTPSSRDRTAPGASPPAWERL